MEKRDQILKAAIECFTNYGYSKTTMSDIGRMVGMNKASLYYHFKDKLELYSVVVHNLRIEHMAALKLKLKTIEKSQHIIEFLKSEIDFAKSISFNYLSGSGGAEHNKDETKDVFNDIIQHDVAVVRDLLSDELTEGSITECDPQEMAIRILLVSQGLLLANCPLDMPMSKREDAYNAVKYEIGEVVGLILKGLASDK